MGKCDERPWVYRAEPITNMSRPLSNKHSTEIGAYLTRYLRRTVVQTRGEGEGGGVSTSVKCLVSITHRVNPHAGSPGGRVHSMSVECLFSMTPSYRRTEEEEKDEEGEIQRRSSACSLFSITPLYRRMEEEEKDEEEGEIQRRSSAGSQTHPCPDEFKRERAQRLHSRAYTRPHFSSTYAFCVN
jgi:hypothetical protein